MRLASRYVFGAAGTAVVAILLWRCQVRAPTARVATTPSSSAFVTVLSPALKGTVAGRLVALEFAQRSSAEVAERVCGNRSVQVVSGPSKGGALAGALVAVVDESKSQSGKQVADIAIQNCSFLPTLFITQGEAEISIANSDPVLHNIVIRMGDRVLANHLLSSAAKPFVFSPKAPGPIRITCELHDWEYAEIIVSRFTHASVTGQDGDYVMGELGDGKHVLIGWHPVLGATFDEVTVVSGETVKRDLFIRADEQYVPQNDKCCVAAREQSSSKVVVDVCSVLAPLEWRAAALRGLMQSIPQACK